MYLVESVVLLEMGRFYMKTLSCLSVEIKGHDAYYITEEQRLNYFTLGSRKYPEFHPPRTADKPWVFAATRYNVEILLIKK